MGHDLSDPVLALGELALRFGRVDRITYHEDGTTRESDTDHTVMLGLVACAFASQHLHELNPSLIAEFALVHDLVEVYAGDTNTLRIDEDQKVAKKQREHEAKDRIEAEFLFTLPWLPIMIHMYEQQLCSEARYVKAMDKLLPKVTHILNNLRTVHDQQMTRSELVERYDQQLEELKAYASDFPTLFELRAELIDMVLAKYPKEETTDDE